jgi:hypothetical protein
MPSKKPTECCEGLNKFTKEEYYDACDTECSRPDMCCKGKCIAKALGLVKDDGTYDKTIALKSMSTAFGGDSAWTAVYTKAADDCVAEGMFQ